MRIKSSIGALVKAHFLGAIPVAWIPDIHEVLKCGLIIPKIGPKRGGAFLQGIKV
jgi:hypothetical protein